MLFNGTQKNVIKLNSTGSRYFEEAYFIMRPTAQRYPESDIVAEANRIVAELDESRNLPAKPRKMMQKINFLWLGVGFLGGVAISVLATSLL